MNTENDITSEEESPQFVEPGTLLKEKREALGLTQQQVADRLRLRLSIIQNLEENKFDTDLVATFIRGYLRSYAKAVGLKESEVLDAYAQRNGAAQQEQTMQSFSKKTKRAKHDSHIMTITWVIMIVLIGMSSLWWWQNHRDTGFSDPDAEVSAVLDNESTIQQSNSEHEFATVSELTEESGEETIEPAQESPVDEPNDEMITEEVASQDESPQAEENQSVEAEENQSVEAEEASVIAAAEESVVAEQPTTSAASENLLTMSFSADCWVQVKDASGKTLVTGIKQAGQSVSLNGQKPLQVILGAPEGVTMIFASEPVDLSGYTSGKVARFTLP